MPIRFRCGYCKRLLGIARRKAGTETTCPYCHYTITVPPLPVDDRTHLAEFEALVNPFASPTTPEPEPQPVEAKPHGVLQHPRAAEPQHEGERPLFEQELDAVLSDLHTAHRPDEQMQRHPPTSGMDALSLSPERGQLVLNSRKITVVAIGVFVLMVLSFLAGYLVASAR